VGSLLNPYSEFDQMLDVSS